MFIFGGQKLGIRELPGPRFSMLLTVGRENAFQHQLLQLIIFI